MKYYVTPTRGIALKFQGIIDLPELYRQMKLWLEDRGYAKEENLEKAYIEKIKGNNLKQIEILWEGSKNVSDYFKYKIRIQFILLGVTETEVTQENIKRKLYKGNFQIYITGYVEEGEDKEWKNVGIISKLYHNLVAKRRIEDHKLELYNKIYSFQESIKNFLKLRT